MRETMKSKMIPPRTAPINMAEGPCVAWGAETMVLVGVGVTMGKVIGTVVAEPGTNDAGSGMVVIEVERRTDGTNAPESVDARERFDAPESVEESSEFPNEETGDCTDEATGDCPNEVTGDCTDDATNEATGNCTDEATGDCPNEATGNWTNVSVSV
jgi:hypothetical protein